MSKRILAFESRKQSITSKDRIKRCFIHFFVGLANGWLFTLGKSIGMGSGPAWIFGIYFALYELNEDLHLRDGAWIDIQGWLFGFIGYFILIALFPGLPIRII